ncbi:MAG: HNH endonuclease [Candidatus Kapaibacteriales bacterium]
MYNTSQTLFFDDTKLLFADGLGSSNDYFEAGPMSARVLVLNQSYQPLTVCSAKKAIVLLYLAKAEIVIDRPGKAIRSVKQAFSFPSVIRLSRYVKVPFMGIELSRKNVMKRDNHTCQYCGSKASLTLDHVLPRSRGGQDSWENLVVACISCNNKKGNRLPNEAGMPLKRKPQKPNYFMYLKNYLGDINDDWQQFMYH